MTQIIPTAEPFLLHGNKTGILLIHGFTGAPKEMRWMGEYLHAQGYTCLGVRLHGHATRIKDMERSRWTDWTASVEDGYHLLRGVCDRIFIAGLSMGGALSLLMSTRLDVAGVIAMSAPYALPGDDKNYPPAFIRLYSRLVRFMPKGNQPLDSFWFDKEAFAAHVSYDENPVRSVAELKELLLAMQAALPNIRQPVLLIHSKNDNAVPHGDMEKIYAALTGAADKTKVYIEGSGHVITRDKARGQVFELAREFIQRNLQP
ncbi:MAG: alpha/beta fold hydrolase [Anaerolineales bacterium]